MMEFLVPSFIQAVYAVAAIFLAIVRDLTARFSETGFICPVHMIQ